MFKKLYKGNEEEKKVIMMFDGLEEISKKYKKNVIDLMKGLNNIKKNCIEKLWVKKRKKIRGDLEENIKKIY